jgi:nucleoside-diphosphate-sugar epimerase
LSADTGWEAEIPLETTLKDTLDWWRARVAEED